MSLDVQKLSDISYDHSKPELSKKDQERLRKLLHRRDELVMHRAQRTDAISGVMTSDEIEQASCGAAIDESALILTRESSELLFIEERIRNISNGIRQKCDLCQKRIPAERLDALPYATHCVDCMRKIETQQ